MPQAFCLMLLFSISGFSAAFAQEPAPAADPLQAPAPSVASEDAAGRGSSAPAETGAPPAETGAPPAEPSSTPAEASASAPAGEPAPGEPAPGQPAPGQPAPTGEPPEISEEAKALFIEFVEKQDQWSKTLAEIRRIQILYSNNEDRTAEILQRYRELRDQSRRELNEVFAAAERVFEAHPGEFFSGSMLATTLDYRRTQSMYENSYHAAKLLLSAGVPLPDLLVMAARSAFVEGHFDDVMPLYERFVEANGVEKLEQVDHQIANVLDFYPQWWQEELENRRADAEADDLPRVLLETTRGPVVLELFEDRAPNTVANFIHLVEQGFYDGLEFYQVIEDLLVMGGDPLGNGTGTSGRFIPDEYDRPDRRRIFRGSIFMAKMPQEGGGGKFVADTASSQFVIALMPIIPKEQTQTVFGRVIQGIDVVSSFQRIDPQKKKEQQFQVPPDRILTARVIRKRDHDYSVTYTR